MVHANSVQKTPAPCVHFALLCPNTKQQEEESPPSHHSHRPPGPDPATTGTRLHITSHNTFPAIFFSFFPLFPLPPPLSLSPQFPSILPPSRNNKEKKNQSGSRASSFHISLQSPATPEFPDHSPCIFLASSTATGLYVMVLHACTSYHGCKNMRNLAGDTIP